MTVGVVIGPQLLGDLDAAAQREWLVTDGLGGYAMGTAALLRTRRYHGLLVVAEPDDVGIRSLGLVSLDPVLVLGDRRVRLATHEWADGTIAPAGHTLLQRFTVDRGVPSWRWQVGDVVLEVELAMASGRRGVGVVHRLVRAPDTVRVEVEALSTWRSIHGEREAGPAPDVAVVADGFAFEGLYRVRGPAFDASGATWWRGDHHREEAARGLAPDEDLWRAGAFCADLDPGDVLTVEAWPVEDGELPPATELVARARSRFDTVSSTAGATTDAERVLAHAADQHVVHTSSGPTVVAGYPWFGEWSRDTFLSYEGLFLATGRVVEGSVLLRRAAALVEGGLLPNTPDVDGDARNSADGTPWFLHAVARHVATTGDEDLRVELEPVLGAIVDAHVRGTQHGIRVGDDGLLTQGEEGFALTWMDAVVAGRPVTARAGKAVEINAVWLAALDSLGVAPDLVGRGWRSFRRRFSRGDGAGLYDIVDGPLGDDPAIRPNQLVAVALGLGAGDAAAAAVRAGAPRVTPLGLRTLSPADPRYVGRHRGSQAERDAAYHQGTVWPWLLGPYVDACRAIGVPAPDGLLDGVVAHLDDAGLGSVSETADGDAPHGPTGCPYQAWSVAEAYRALRSG
jgi:predicted glycogen debranching enzyme